MQARRAPDAEWLFPSAQRGNANRPAKSLRETLLLARKACGLPRFGFHDCRHFFASLCVMSGIDFMTIARWVGHQDGGVLIGKVYGHLSNEHAQRQAARVNFGPILMPLGASPNEDRIGRTVATPVAWPRYCQGRAVDEGPLRWLPGWRGEHRHWSRKQLARELCQHGQWRNERGQLKDFAARSFLLKLEANGWIRLPARQVQKRRPPRGVAVLRSWEEPPARQGTLRELQPLTLQVVSSGTEAAQRWVFYLDRYHYLGFRVGGEPELFGAGS